MGPFDVDSGQIERLHAAFTQFVNELLVVECRAAGLQGHQVQVTRQDNTADGGVDAEITCSIETEWLPANRSTWQFKRLDLEPAECHKELRGARWAQDLLRSGAAYRLVLGRSLTSDKVDARRDALIAEARAVGITVGDGQIDVIAGDTLAEWASRFPAIAVGALLAGPGHGLIDFVTWSNWRRHQTRWVQDESRRLQIEQLRSDLSSPARTDFRVHGRSGSGKTRLVMEALRDSELKELVAYVAQESDVSPEILHHVLQPHRAAVLVVDECSARRHDKLAERIPVGSSLRLITIGETDEYRLDVPILEIGILPPDELDEFLRLNHGGLTPETRRVVIQQSAGNIRQAIILAREILRTPAETVAELIQAADVEQFFALVLPEGRSHFLGSVLALFERVGWDGELRPELESICAFAAATVEEYMDVERDLTSRGILERQGRYRAISPHPLAVGLAAQLWRTEGRRIIDELFPALDRDMALALFGRLSHLGSFGPARATVRQLLSSEGPFDSLETIETHRLGEFLIRLAVVAPDETMVRLERLIGEASLEELRTRRGSRRDLVWSLEKLAWHSRTFEAAADALLRLALAENESYANNATGTWLALFGAALPATAASPATRIACLERLARSASAEVRMLVARACAARLHPHESVAVSGELQGGSLVEPRGGVLTLEEQGEYRRNLIRILRELRNDPTQLIAEEATRGLVAAIHPYIDDPYVGEEIANAIASFEGSDLDQVRREIRHLQDIFRRVGDTDSPRVVAINRLAQSLPALDALHQLRLLVNQDPWTLQEPDRSEELRAAITTVIEQGSLGEILLWLRDSPFPAAWFVGHALGDALVEPQGQLIGTLIDAIDINPAALAGFLSARVDRGDLSAFDDLLDSTLAEQLSPSQILGLTARGPVTDRSKVRAFELIAQLSVAEGASALSPMRRELSAEDVTGLVADWITRTRNQDDYNILVDWLNLWAFDRQMPTEIRARLGDLIAARASYPELGNASWDWSQLARLYCADAPLETARLILDLISEEHLMLIGGEEEANLLLAAAIATPQSVWEEIGSRIERGDWRIQMMLRKWFVSSIPISVIAEWVGHSVDRAQIVASLADPGHDQPTEVARFLLTEFSEIDEVRGALAGAFMSGSWTGPLSVRAAGQILQLQAWVANSDEPEGVKRWATEMIATLRADRDASLEREAEGRF